MAAPRFVIAASSRATVAANSCGLFLAISAGDSASADEAANAMRHATMAMRRMAEPPMSDAERPHHEPLAEAAASKSRVRLIGAFRLSESAHHRVRAIRQAHRLGGLALEGIRGVQNS